MIRTIALTGLLAGLALAAGPVSAAEHGPSFDCAKAEHEAEVLICGDAQLAALDREIARLYRLAARGLHMDDERLKELKAVQRGWIKGRDECWKAAAPGACVRDDQAMRIHALRAGYFDARSDDDAGVSTGPFVAECPGLDAAVGLTFIGVEPPVVALEWRENRVALPLGRTGSGARYAAPAASAAPWLGEGEIVFWVKGDEARFELPGREAMTCGIEDPG